MLWIVHPKMKVNTMEVNGVQEINTGLKFSFLGELFYMFPKYINELAMLNLPLASIEDCLDKTDVFMLLITRIWKKLFPFYPYLALQCSPHGRLHPS